MINLVLNAELQEQLRDRLWQDDLGKMPCFLYPHRQEQELYDFWRQEYDALLSAYRNPVPEAADLFGPAAPADLRPRYVADSGGTWYALVTLRYNQRTKVRFCYLRYWWTADLPGLWIMLPAVLSACRNMPCDWLKLRLGCDANLTPEEIHPRAVRQNYVVAGRPDRAAIQAGLAELNLDRLRVEQTQALQPAWWDQYRLLLFEDKNWQTVLDSRQRDEVLLAELEKEMVHLLEHGGGAINLFEGQTLIGHISWKPDSYREQLIPRCWHINNIIVRPGYRRQGLGEALHLLAAGAMNLLATPIVAGLIAGHNQTSLKAAAKIGRQIVDSHIIVPKA